MKLSRYEQETIVNYNAGEQTATVYTRDKTVMRKLDTLVADFPDTYNLLGQDEVSKTYSLPKSYVSYHKPRAVSHRVIGANGKLTGYHGGLEKKEFLLTLEKAL